MKISLTFPTLFPDAAKRVIENVRSTLIGIDYEIIIVSPFEINGPNIKWVKDVERRGPGAAMSIAATHVTGDVVFPLVDDITLRPNWAQDGLSQLIKHERGRPYAVGIGQINRIVGTVFGIYYPFFPLVRKSVADLVGGFYDPALKHHFTDSDFAFRIWAAGGACGWSEFNYIDRIKRDTVSSSDIESLSASRDASLSRDMAIFVDRWKPRFGIGWKTETLRDFNLDIDPVFGAFLPSGNTIFINNPTFLEAYRGYQQMMAAFQKLAPA